MVCRSKVPYIPEYKRMYFTVISFQENTVTVHVCSTSCLLPPHPHISDGGSGKYSSLTYLGKCNG